MTKGPNFQARIDAAQRKRAEAKQLKAARAAGEVVEPDALLRRILTIDPEADVYLVFTQPTGGGGGGGGSGGNGFYGGSFVGAASSGASGAPAPARPLCRAHFRDEGCFNRRCRWSHALTLAGARPARGAAATSAIPSGGDEDAAAGDGSEPALELVAGFGPRGAASARRRPVGLPVAGAAGRLEALPENVLAELGGWIAASVDLVGLSATCRLAAASLRGVGSEVERRRREALPRLSADRRRWLLKRPNAARVRFVVSHAAANAAATAAAVAAAAAAANVAAAESAATSRVGDDGTPQAASPSASVASPVDDSGCSDAAADRLSPRKDRAKDRAKDKGKDKARHKGRHKQGAVGPGCSDGSCGGGSGGGGAFRLVASTLAHDAGNLSVFEAFCRAADAGHLGGGTAGAAVGAAVDHSGGATPAPPRSSSSSRHSSGSGGLGGSVSGAASARGGAHCVALSLCSLPPGAFGALLALLLDKDAAAVAAASATLRSAAKADDAFRRCAQWHRFRVHLSGHGLPCRLSCLPPFTF